MKINPELLKQITAKSLANKPTGIKGLINGIHKAPRLREWVTLESFCLVPIPVKKGDNWHLMSLLVVAKTLENKTKEFSPPWGAIEWILPQEIVIKTLDLRWYENFNKLNQKTTINPQPADSKIVLDPVIKNQRQDILYQLLDQLILQPFDLANLAPHYSGLLPKEIYRYYWELIPESKQWLNPDISAIDLSDSTNQENELSDQSSLTIPADLSSYVNHWLSQLQEISDSYNLFAISNPLHNYEYRLLQPNFRLAIVGEFSRGKSFLLNRLLEGEFLPVGSLPTTSTLISIIADSQNKIEIYSPNKPVEIRPLNEESWSDLLAIDPTGNNQEILAKIRVKLNNSWLEKLDVELIDTPGAGDLSTQRSALVFDLLSQCDGAVLVISASMALSLTEIAFLEEEIIGRHVPRILVIVSKLDTIKPKERKAVFENISERLAKISPIIPLLPLHPIDDSQSEKNTLLTIKNYLEKMTEKGERKVWRFRQIAGQLMDCCQQLKSLGETTIANANLEEGQRQEEIKKLQEKVQSAELYWQQIELDLEQKRQKNYQRLETKIFEIKANLLEVLKFQLKKTSNPKSWWQEDLPFTLRKELVTFSRSVENFIIQKIAEDNTWLEEKIKQLFGQEIATVIPVNNYNLNLLSEVEDLPLADLQKYRLLTRLGSSAAVIAGYVLGGPIGIIASTGIWLLGENMMNKTAEEQKQIIEEELEQKINLSLNQYCQKVGERLRQIYQQIIQEIKQEKKIWKQNQQILVDNINSNNSQEDIKKWTQLINQVNDLENTISNTIKNVRS